MKACDEHSSRTVFEIAHGQRQKMLECTSTERGVDAIAGGQYKVLPYPAHCRIEDDENGERKSDDDRRIDGLMNDHFVDDDLRAQGCGECHHLNHE